MIAYFDTAALIKRFIAEDGSAQAAQVWAAARSLVTGRLAYPEARAALAAAHRDQRLSDDAFVAAKGELEALWAELFVVAVTPALVAAAGDLAEHHRLCGHGAVHLACARSISSPDLVLVTWDGGLRAAALAAGLATAP